MADLELKVITDKLGDVKHSIIMRYIWEHLLEWDK